MGFGGIGNKRGTESCLIVHEGLVVNEGSMGHIRGAVEMEESFILTKRPSQVSVFVHPL